MPDCLRLEGISVGRLIQASCPGSHHMFTELMQRGSHNPAVNSDWAIVYAISYSAFTSLRASLPLCGRVEGWRALLPGLQMLDLTAPRACPVMGPTATAWEPCSHAHACAYVLAWIQPIPGDIGDIYIAWPKNSLLSSASTDMVLIASHSQLNHSILPLSI